MILNDAMDWNDIKGECVTHISIRNPICEQRDKSNVDEDENYHIVYNHRVKCRMSQMFCTKDMPPATRERWKKKKISPYDDAQLPREGRQIMNIKFLVWRRRDVWSIVKVHTHKNEIDFCSSLVGRKTFHYIFREGEKPLWLRTIREWRSRWFLAWNFLYVLAMSRFGRYKNSHKVEKYILMPSTAFISCHNVILDLIIIF